MSKYQNWWDNLSPQMKEYLQNQPVWYDRDLYKSAFFGFVIGVLVGFII